MKSLLFINGCVRTNNSRTLKIARTYISKINENNQYDIKEVNLGSGEMHYINSMSFNSMTGEQKYRDSTLAREFACADMIIIAAPFWEFMFPAVLSCYIENISFSGITFRYNENGSIGMCNADSLVYIYTSGDYLKEEDKQSEKYLLRLSKFFGIDKFSSIFVDGLDIEGNNPDKMVDDMCKSIRNDIII